MLVIPPARDRLMSHPCRADSLISDSSVLAKKVHSVDRGKSDEKSDHASAEKSDLFKTPSDSFDAMHHPCKTSKVLNGPLNKEKDDFVEISVAAGRC